MVSSAINKIFVMGYENNKLKLFEMVSSLLLSVKKGKWCQLIADNVEFLILSFELNYVRPSEMALLK
jgi:uncharacterized phage-like protein YoqJ